ncbi:hypothetical protein [Bradyrhizobium sp. CCBAU 45389]|uniref:hypothetical protein n=1 Tax=Bradyrhizobium sp. CCBAU 45389 TaxID=858429 RepID=UPI0023052A63|nr:hypothetical protein [Bradyrhizobium sp. CCBAU 45389]
MVEQRLDGLVQIVERGSNPPSRRSFNSSRSISSSQSVRRRPRRDATKREARDNTRECTNSNGTARRDGSKSKKIKQRHSKSADLEAKRALNRLKEVDPEGYEAFLRKRENCGGHWRFRPGWTGEAIVTTTFLAVAFAQLWRVVAMRSIRSGTVVNEFTRNPWVWLRSACTALCSQSLSTGRR